MMQETTNPRSFIWPLLAAAALFLFCSCAAMGPSAPVRSAVHVAAAELVGSGKLHGKRIGIGEFTPSGEADAAYAEATADMLMEEMLEYALRYDFILVPRERLQTFALEKNLRISPEAPHTDLAALRKFMGLEVLVAGIAHVDGDREKLTVYAMDTATGSILVLDEAASPAGMAERGAGVVLRASCD